MCFLPLIPASQSTAGSVHEVESGSGVSDQNFICLLPHASRQKCSDPRSCQVGQTRKKSRHDVFFVPSGRVSSTSGQSSFFDVWTRTVARQEKTDADRCPSDIRAEVHYSCLCLRSFLRRARGKMMWVLLLSVLLASCEIITSGTK